MTDSTLPSDATPCLFDSSAPQLRRNRPPLDTSHTRLSPFVTIDNLPAEILCYIFMHAKVHCIHDALFERSSKRFWSGDQSLLLFSPDNLSSVCVYWRKLLNNTPALWTHIDLGIGQLQDASFAFHAQRSLECAKQLPLHIHVEGTKKRSKPRGIIALLAPHANRIVSLELSGNALASRYILLGLFSTPYRSSVQHLCLYDENYEGLHAPQGGLLASGLLGEFLLSLPSLSLRGPSLDYNSPAFQGLTDLAIVFSDMCPTPYQLTQILAACPALRSLTLLSLSLALGNPPSNAANLSSLRALDLRHMKFGDVITIMSCIVPRRGLSMSITLNMRPDDDDDDDGHIHDLSPLSPFLKQFHIARLFLNADQLYEGLDLDSALSSLENPLPSLEELALDGELLHDSLLEGGLLAVRFPRLHTFHILGETIPLDQLKSMLASSPVQAVRFRWKKRHPSEVLKAISDLVPSVFYSLHNTLMDDEPFPWDLPSISYYDNGVL